MMRTAVLTLLTALALVAMPAGHTAVISFHLDLSGTNEIPANASPGTGTADIELDTVLRTLSLDVTFAGLLATTTAAHIHCCTPSYGQRRSRHPGSIVHRLPLGRDEWDLFAGLRYDAGVVLQPRLHRR